LRLKISTKSMLLTSLKIFDIRLKSNIFSKLRYWQEMSDFENRQIVIRFGKYHRFSVTFDNLNVSPLRHEVAYFDC